MLEDKKSSITGKKGKKKKRLIYSSDRFFFFRSVDESVPRRRDAMISNKHGVRV